MENTQRVIEYLVDRDARIASEIAAIVSEQLRLQRESYVEALFAETPRLELVN